MIFFLKNQIPRIIQDYSETVHRQFKTKKVIIFMT